ncbi:protein qua-1-like [Littorina saxatilis]|uniref:Uncharacterized protein n=1 Tax=Littorina saxatilis TaxID=31220 RepID=A0AAN9GG35_9CAEN
MMERKILGVFILGFLVSNATGQQDGGNLTCPRQGLLGQKVTITLTIDRSLFPSLCETDPDRREALFTVIRLSDPWRSTWIMCTVLNITSPGTCQGAYTTGTLGCGCVGKTDELYTLENTFIVDSLSVGNWSAELSCQTADRTRKPISIYVAPECNFGAASMANASSSSASANITAQANATSVSNQTDQTTANNTGGNVTAAGDVTTVSSSLTTLRTDSVGGGSGGSTIDITLYAGIAGGVVALVLAIIGAMAMLQKRSRKFAPTPVAGNAFEPPLDTLDDDEGEDGDEGIEGGEDEGDEGGEGVETGEGGEGEGDEGGAEGVETGEGGEGEGDEGGEGVEGGDRGAGDDDDPSDMSPV